MTFLDAITVTVTPLVVENGFIKFLHVRQNLNVVPCGRNWFVDGNVINIDRKMYLSNENNNQPCFPIALLLGCIRKKIQIDIV